MTTLEWVSFLLQTARQTFPGRKRMVAYHVVSIEDGDEIADCFRAIEYFAEETQRELTRRILRSVKTPPATVEEAWSQLQRDNPWP